MVLKLRIPPPSNWEGAKCHLIEVDRDYDPFFPDDDLPTEAKDQQLAEAVEFCNGTADGEVCELRDGCLIFALTNNLKTGVWGGTTPLTRKSIRRQWPLRRGKEPRPEWHWMDEETALALHSPVEQAELIVEPDYDEEEEDEWAV